MHAWEKRNNDARAADQRALNEHLLQLERNQNQLIEKLGKLHIHAQDIPIKCTHHRYAPGQCHGNDGVTSATTRSCFGWRSRTAVLLAHSPTSDHDQWTSGRNGKLDDHILRSGVRTSDRLWWFVRLYPALLAVHAVPDFGSTTAGRCSWELGMTRKLLSKF